MLLIQQGNITAVADSCSLLIKNDISNSTMCRTTNFNTLLVIAAKMAFNMILTLFNLLLQNSGFKSIYGLSNVL